MPKIYVMRTDELLDLEFIEDDALVNATVAQAYQRHVRKGLDARVLKPCSPRSIDPRYDVSNADLLAAEQADLRGEPVFICALGLGIGRTFQMLHVEDWLAELKLRDPRVYGALHKMSFQQMYDHSCKWHDAMARRSANMRDHGIPHDPEGAPVVLQLDGEFDGWTWVWLRTDKARDLEGEVMGNCVGGGSYDDLGPHEGIFSLRDKRNAPRVTVHLDGHRYTPRQSEGRGGESIADKYEHLVDGLIEALGVRLAINNDPMKPVVDGMHTTDRVIYRHVENGRYHRLDGPSVHYAGDNKKLGELWYFNGKLHRTGGPAVIADEGGVRWFHHGIPMRNQISSIAVGVTKTEYFLDGGCTARTVRLWSTLTKASAGSTCGSITVSTSIGATASASMRTARR